jgi:DNA-directed RNA polymerase specialized sigma subunit
MPNFDQALCDIFDRRVTTGTLPLKKEREAIRAAKCGDDEATLKLLYAYACALRKVSGMYRHAGGAWACGPGDSGPAGDRRMAAVEGFLEALYAFDLGGIHSRLAATVEAYIANSISSAASAPAAMNVPDRTLKRFYSILRKADGDPVKGAALAPRYCMTTETFMSVLTALRSTESLDDPSDDAGGAAGDPVRLEVPVCGPDYYEDVENKLLVETAFAAVDSLEAGVCRLAYGFSDDGPLPDSEVGHRLGLSRPKVQRMRTSALGKMRSAVGIA